MPPEVPHLPGILSAGEVVETARAIASVQLPNGCIPPVPGGLADPWNHLEAAMALDVGGLRAEAAGAYEWLARTQREDGSWAIGYRNGVVEDGGADANFCSYIATAAWHHHLAAEDPGFLARIWPVVDRAIEFTLGLQAPGGEVLWARDAVGRAWPGALLTSNSCIHLSLGCALAIAEQVGRQRPAWDAAQAAVGEAIRSRPAAFEAKDRWSMDWYYPILGRVIDGPAAEARLKESWDRFVVPGIGVRCVADQPWVTVAETCELVLALDASGWDQEARDLFSWVHKLRGDDGAYWTGITFPEAELWPEERPTWTSGAVLMAADALCGASRTSGLFREDFLSRVA